MSERVNAPRSGGRTAERTGAERRGTPAAPGPGGARGARRHPAGAATEGTAALKLDPVRHNEPVVLPQLRVAPPSPISAPRAPFVAVIIALVVAGVLGVLVINTKTNENAFRISKLEDQKAALDNQQQALENQIAGYESTGNLDAAARRLGLVKAPTPAYIRLPDGRIIGVPKPGTGEPAVTAQDATAAAAQNAQNGVTGNNAPAQNNATTQNGTTQNGTTQNGTTQNGVSQNGTGQNGAGSDGAGAVPGAGQ